MSTVNNLDTLVKWLEKNVCVKTKLKVPKESEPEQDPADYVYEIGNPTAFAVYLPDLDRRTIIDSKNRVPSITVQLMDGEDDPIKRVGKMNVRFHFATWNPGNYDEDYYISTGEGALQVFRPNESTGNFAAHGEGWRELWNLVDFTRRELESAESIRNMRLVKESGIKYGPYKEDEDTLIDFYPYWYAWLDCVFEFAVVRSPNYYVPYDENYVIHSLSGSIEKSNDIY